MGQSQKIFLLGALMKISLLFVLTLTLLGRVALASPPAATVKNIKKIVCASMAHYEEETPNDKTPAALGEVKIFTPGSRSDVKQAPGAFLLEEIELGDNAARDDGDQQYYFSVEKNGTLSFAFIAAWKASGSLKIGAYNGDKGYAASGILNQKSHITELGCIVQLK
jgi:hypothetical protein